MNALQIPTKIPTAIIGATGTVGRKFISLLENHPWFEITALAASANSAGKTYREAINGRPGITDTFSAKIGNLIIFDAQKDVKKISDRASLVFSALSLDKKAVSDLEIAYAAAGAAIVSNNSAHRWTADVPMILPEINPDHVKMIDIQRRLRSWSTGLIAVKPNCSIQSFMPVLDAFKNFHPEKVIVSTYQAVSGAGKTIAAWPEMQDNVNPYIGGEEEKSEREPLRIWGKIIGDRLEIARLPEISTTCVRVPVSDGHLATVNVSFAKKPNLQDLQEAIINFQNPIADLKLPSSPEQFLTLFSENDRPQTALDRDIGNGMGISVGRLRPDTVLDWKFVALSHNTKRGAAGGAVLMAELLVHRGYINY